MREMFWRAIFDFRLAATLAGMVMLVVAAACGTAPATTPTPSAAPQSEEPPDSQEETGTAETPEAGDFPPGVGDMAPDFNLPVATGGEVTLSQYRGDKPVVLVFYRAFW